MSSLWTRVSWNVFTLRESRRARRLSRLSPAAVAQAQDRRVRAIVRHAYETVPFYREGMRSRGLLPADFATAADLAKLPLIASRDVAADWSRFRSEEALRDPPLELHSSGTSGRAHRFTHDPAALFLVLAAGQRQRDVLAGLVGRSLGYRELSVQRPGGLSRQLRRFYEQRTLVPRALDIQRAEVSSAAPFETIAQTIDELRPDVLRGYGSQLGALFRWAWREGRRFHHPRVVTYGGDLMPEADRALIETELAIPVWSTYQAGEALRIGYQCERRAGFHVECDQVAIRVVDGTGRSLGPGERGEIVLSNLVNRATVLLNYKLGDVVTLSATACPCGRSLPTIERIDGRADDLIVMPDRSPLHGLSLLGPLYDRFADLVQVQLVQEELRRFVLSVVAPAGAEWGPVSLGLDRLVRELLGDDLTLDVRRVDAIAAEPSGKVRTVVSRCRDAGGARDAG